MQHVITLQHAPIQSNAIQFVPHAFATTVSLLTRLLTRHLPPQQGAARKPSTPPKPAWALSTAEVDHIEATEEDDLLRFAEGLDFDSFVSQLDDVELQDTFKVGARIRGRPSGHCVVLCGTFVSIDGCM